MRIRKKEYPKKTAPPEGAGGVKVEYLNTLNKIEMYTIHFSVEVPKVHWQEMIEEVEIMERYYTRQAINTKKNEEFLKLN